MPTNLLVEIQARNPVTNAIESLRMSRKGAPASATVHNGEVYLPVVSDWGDRSVTVMDNGELQAPTTSHGDLVFLVNSNYKNEAWGTYSFDGRPCRMWVGDAAADFEGYKLVFQGTCGSISRSGLEFTLGLSGPESKVAKNLLSSTYAGMGGLEGSSDLTGVEKPWCSGRALNISGVLIDTVYMVYQFHGYGATGGVTAVYENAYPISNGSAATVSTYDELIALELTAGEWAQCPALGLYRLGGAASGLITADVLGAVVDGTASLALSQIVRHMLLQRVTAAEIDTASLERFGQEWCYYADAQVQIGDVVRDALRQAGGYLFPDASGRWMAGDFFADGEIGTLAADRSAYPMVEAFSQIASTAPVYRVKVGHTPAWTVHSDDQISNALKWEDVTGEGKPQDGATVGAPVGTEVGGVPVEDVVDAISADDGAIIRARQLQADIATAQQIAADLMLTYGDTVNAAASADAAAQHEATAKLAAENAQAAGADAVTSKTAAATSASQSETFRNEASTAKEDAEGFAATASEQAGLAATSANLSGQSASAAVGSASVATTKANEASQSAEAALSSQVRASSFAQDSMSRAAGNIVGRGAFDGTSGKGSWSGAADVVYDGGIGEWVMQQSDRDVVEGDMIAGDLANRRFRVSGNVAAFSSFAAAAGLQVTMADGSLGYYIPQVAAAHTGYIDFSAEFVLPAGVKSARPILVSDGPWGASDHGVNWRTIRIEDVTSEAAAQEFADAASSSYASAAYEAGRAGQSANAASGYANTATQRANDSDASASASAGSAAHASNEAAAAASSANLAATYSTAGGNLLSNTDFAVDLSGWAFTQFGTSHSGGRDLLGDGYRPENEHSIGVYQANSNPADYAFWQADRIPIDSIKLYEFSVGGANSRCTLTIVLRYRYGDGSVSQDFTTTKDWYSEGNALANFPTIWVRGQPPAGTQWVECIILKNGTSPGYGDSYAWFVRPQFREVYASAPAPAAYAPGRAGAALAAQKAQIDQTATAIATANQSLASLQTTVSSGSGNLLRNGGFEQGMSGWSATHSGWFAGTLGGWGQVAQRVGDWGGGYCYMDTDTVPIFAGQNYTFAADSLYLLYSGSGYCYTELIWVDGAGNVVGQNTGQANPANHDFGAPNALAVHKLTATAPGNATHVRARLVHYLADGSVNVVGWRRAKFQEGDIATAYTAEAAVMNLSETIVSVDGKANTALARAGVRLDVNGYVSGWETANNGVSSNFVVNADNFEIRRPGSVERVEYSSGHFRFYDANGRLRTRIGVWA